MSMEVIIWYEPASNHTSISFVMDVNGKRHIAKPVEMEFVEHKDFAPVEPTLLIRMPR